jgi:hypothetical protein
MLIPNMGARTCNIKQSASPTRVTMGDLHFSAGFQGVGDVEPDNLRYGVVGIEYHLSDGFDVLLIGPVPN